MNKDKKYKTTLVVNLFGGPGRGKSALCAGLFYELKKRGVDCEIAWEYAKGKVWEGSMGTLENQLYLFAKQQHQLFRLEGKVEVVITDAPLLISAVYDFTRDPVFLALIKSRFNSYNNLNFLLMDKFDYNENGRLQTEEGSDAVQADIIRTLDEHYHGDKVMYVEIKQGEPYVVDMLASSVEKALEVIKK